GARVTGSQLLANPNILTQVRQGQADTAKRLEITRDDIVRGLLGVIEVAREQGNAADMIRAAAEINKMLGFYPQGKSGGQGPAAATAALNRYEELSDAELEAVLAGVNKGGDRAPKVTYMFPTLFRQQYRIVMLSPTK
ncbi:MAG: hypothetical protein GY764_11830, partial [Halieaceae bacterium]|nr:hypothetical protein [Halieaceae bacterium]